MSALGMQPKMGKQKQFTEGRRRIEADEGEEKENDYSQWIIIRRMIWQMA